MTNLSLALRVEKIRHNGFLLEDLGSAKFLNHYHQFYFYFNISQLESNYRKLVANTYILELKNSNATSFSLINALKSNCLQIESELSKFNHRTKRALVNALGSAIRFITGNLDQDDLNEINNNLDILLKNQEKVVKQINAYTSFANHITERYAKDMKIIQSNLNTSLNALTDLGNKLNNELIIQYNIYLAQQLLTTLQIIQRTIALAFNDITNLEAISTFELSEILNHLKIIYKKEQLLELDSLHLLKIIEFTKFKVISIQDVITCILYVPILDSSPFAYQRIYPIPNEQLEILLPPAKYRLFGAKGEYWTDESCLRVENQVLCLNELKEDKCSLTDLNTCNFVKVTNNFKLVKQLNNNKVLISTKIPTKIVEECDNKVSYNSVVDNVLISSENNCKLLVENLRFENTNSNFTFDVPKIYINDFKATHHVSLVQKHLDDFSKLKREAKELSHLEIKPLVHVFHISVTAILLLISATVCVLLYLYRNSCVKLFKVKQDVEIPLQDKCTDYSFRNLQGEDALS